MYAQRVFTELSNQTPKVLCWSTIIGCQYDTAGCRATRVHGDRERERERESDGIGHVIGTAAVAATATASAAAAARYSSLYL